MLVPLGKVYAMPVKFGRANEQLLVANIVFNRSDMVGEIDVNPRALMMRVSSFAPAGTIISNTSPPTTFGVTSMREWNVGDVNFSCGKVPVHCLP